MAWNAQLTISGSDDGWFHVNCRVRASSIDEALAGETFVANTLAGGKLAAFRGSSNSSPFRDYDVWEGGVRFSFRDEPGEWKYPDRSLEQFQGFGLGACAT